MYTTKTMLPTGLLGPDKVHNFPHATNEVFEKCVLLRAVSACGFVFKLLTIQKLSLCLFILEFAILDDAAVVRNH